jgi:hypothetical protein
VVGYLAGQGTVGDRLAVDGDRPLLQPAAASRVGLREHDLPAAVDSDADLAVLVYLAGRERGAGRLGVPPGAVEHRADGAGQVTGILHIPGLATLRLLVDRVVVEAVVRVGGHRRVTTSWSGWRMAVSVS